MSRTPSSVSLTEDGSRLLCHNSVTKAVFAIFGLLAARVSPEA